MNIAEAINKLQSIDVKDLKNIDLVSVQDNLRGKPEILIIIILILLSLSATIYLYINSKKTIKELEKEHVALVEKMDAVDRFKEHEIKHKNFLDEFPESIVADDLIDRISGFAIDRNIKIISFTPAQEIKSDFTRVERVNFNVAADEYSHLIEFLRDVEHAPFAVRMENVSAKLRVAETRRSRRGRQEEPEVPSDPVISATISIAAIELDERK